MAQLSNKIKEYCKANGVNEVDFSEDVQLVDVGEGAYIDIWNLNIPKPTDEQLDALETEAQTYENNQEIIDTRKKLYGSWENQLEEIYDNGIDAWKTRIAQVKADNPKE
tara:strand:+ start:575 stop:901 length:327 start_codon:yes stop_codon:yes gene_type:complete